MSVQVSPSITLQDLVYHPKCAGLGIVNVPPEEHLPNLIRLCQEVGQPIFDLLHNKVQVISGYRNPQLQTALVRQGRNSLPHEEGRALDFQTPGMDVSEGFDLIAASQIPFDSLTWFWNRAGNNWIEVTIPRDGEEPRRLARRCVKMAERVFL